MHIIDLRSDTMTLPTPKMREAMLRAKVSDDTVDGDPSVIELEARVASLLGKEAGLLVLSGTMANQVAVMTSCRPGDEVIVSEESHIYNLETGGLSSLAGVQPRPLPSPGGLYPMDLLLHTIKPKGVQSPQAAMVCLENTQDLNRGIVVNPERMAQLASVVKGHGVHVYLDGARLFNAAAALGVPPAEIARPADFVMVCLSKGLAAPGGAVLAGDRQFIERARRIRQRLGGGMRQIAGFMAAAGLVALDTMLPRLSQDHHNARKLAERLSDVAGIVLNPGAVQSNIVSFSLDQLEADEFAERLRREGVLVKPIGRDRARAVTHKDISPDDVDTAVAAVSRVLRNSK